MSYPMDLDEYSFERIEQEYRRRLQCMAKNLCHYCGRDLYDRTPCKLNSHKEEDQE
jgi:hypothetical protein